MNSKKAKALRRYVREKTNEGLSAKVRKYVHEGNSDKMGNPGTRHATGARGLYQSLKKVDVEQRLI